ncbi:hypothetical protein M758_8G042300 [Ceratodon purpureus]|nr:hypothetical protein M758_8G042300 [Ceratodon purpureus]
MTYSWRALCLFHILSVSAICTGARSWQEKDIIATNVQVRSASSVFAFTSSKGKHSKKPHHKRDDEPVDPAPGPSSIWEPCTTKGCIFNVLTFNAVGDGITDDTKVD